MSITGSESESEATSSNDEGPDVADDASPPLNTTLKTSAYKQKFWRAKAKLLPYIVNKMESIDLFVHYCNSDGSKFNLQSPGRNLPYTRLSRWNEEQVKYRGKKIVSIFSKLDDAVHTELLKSWMETLMQHRMIETVFLDYGWEIPDEYRPLHMKVANQARVLHSRFLQRNNVKDDQRKLGTEYVIAVAKASGLSVDLRGSTNLLAKYTCSSRAFAKSVLESIKEGTESSLVDRQRRCDSIHAERGWTDRIAEFVLRPENARAAPGETVSIKYGVRRPRYVLRKSRAVIAQEFLASYPDCKFHASTIIREFPQKAATASSQDRKRNSCPMHCNIRRLVTELA
jgi:hypothetical protein